jgi:hypothetical protein
VFCSCPTLHSTWFRQMPKAMQVGQRLVVIRDDACGEDSAWTYLDDCFDGLGTIDIPDVRPHEPLCAGLRPETAACPKIIL